MSEMSPIASQRDLFDLPRDVAWFNCAYMSPLLNSAVAAGEAGIRRKARPWHLSPPDFFSESERARALFARLVGASPDDVAIVPSASYGIAVAAANLPVGPGLEIVVLEDQFPSNVYAWQRKAAESGASLRIVRRAEAATGTGLDWTSAVEAAIGGRTSVVALPHCLWTDGSLVDLVRIGESVRAHGAALVLDLTQSAGALPFDVGTVKPDFMVAATYKWLLGPYSLGFLYAAPHRQDGRPLEENWIARAGSEDFARLVDYAGDYQPGARRYDMGERSNFHLMPVAVAALEQILEWDVGRIAATLSARNRAIVERAADLGFSALPDSCRAGHFLGLRRPGGVPEGLLAKLADRQVYVSVRGDSIRVTPHLYNDDDDIERLFKSLAAAM